MSHRPVCEDTDPSCPECLGSCEERATATLFRVDMEDRTGTRMCEACTGDAMKSGVFRMRDPGEGAR